MKSIKYIALAALLFFIFLPSFELSRAGQIQNLDTHASEVAKTPDPSVGSGGWIGLFFLLAVAIRFGFGPVKGWRPMIRAAWNAKD